MQSDLEVFRQAVKLSLDFRGRLRRDEVEQFCKRKIRPSAVLVLLAPSPMPSVTREYHLLVTRRSDQLEHHRGQFAFPGGVSEASEIEMGAPGLLQTALREAQEEVGLEPKNVEVLGTLPTLLTPTGFEMTPVIGVSRQTLSEIEVRAHTGEIAEVFWISMNWLMDPKNHQRDYFEVDGKTYPIDVFNFEGRRIWGATGAVLKNWIDRLRAVKETGVKQDE
jgi:8-oxo-dGTP pyrophosphatase MutT (NUDIX family)